jgi:dihydrodipicolinate synthase/N-acetylneuraminate lyase
MSLGGQRETVPQERPGRSIWGASAILLPFTAGHDIHWRDLRRHVERTCQAGLLPAVNMDTGYVHLIDEATEDQVLDQTRDVMAQFPSGTDDRFIAGAVVRDEPLSEFDFAAYARRFEAILSRGGTPIVFPSFGLSRGHDDQIIARYERLAALAPRFYAFELGEMFAACGRIYSLDLFARLLAIPNCVGAKHSSLDRGLEWQRLRLRDRLRPDFRVLTGNDLAIDMVKYGSDYLLGLSTMAPDLFALRDRYWETQDPRFYMLNDGLQYLGHFTFRHPVPAYRHSAAQWLALRGWIATETPHPQALRRPDTDRPILQEIWHGLAPFLND